MKGALRKLLKALFFPLLFVHKLVHESFGSVGELIIAYLLVEGMLSSMAKIYDLIMQFWQLILASLDQPARLIAVTGAGLLLSLLVALFKTSAGAQRFSDLLNKWLGEEKASL